MEPTLFQFVVASFFGGIVWWFIGIRLGYGAGVSALAFVPLANIILILCFAFATSPNELRLRRLRAIHRDAERDAFMADLGDRT